MHPSVYIILLFSVSIRAEYKWTGTEWEWIEPVRDSSSLLTQEGSGDESNPTDDEDYTEYDYNGDYDYGNDFYWSKNKESNSNTNLIDPVGGLPKVGITDDEDFAEGSGLGGGFDAEERDPFNEEPEGSGSLDTDINPIKTSPPIDLDTPDWGLGQTDDTSFIGGSDPIKPVDNPTDSHDDYYNENFYPDGDNEDDLPPFDDISIDDIRGGSANPSTTSTSTSTTTTTTSTVRPFEVDNKPKYSDVPTVSDVPTNRPVSFFAQPGILAAVIGGAVVGLLCAILLVMFIVYRMRKKDEGSYILDEPKRTHNGNLYTKTPNREFYA